MLNLALAVCIWIEWVDWRHNVVKLQATFWNIATSECHLDELYSLVALQVLFSHKFCKLGFLLFIDICLPFLIDITCCGHAFYEAFDKLLLVTQVGTRLDGLDNADISFVQYFP